MAFEHYFSQEWKAIPSAVTDTENSNGCFDCNICLDFACEPVVTLCGHLYCWPCIYQWLHVQGASLAADEHPQCPVCKANISHKTMVPLYGRGEASTQSECDGKASCRDISMPPRPSALSSQAWLAISAQNGQQLPYQNSYQDQHYSPPSSQQGENHPQMIDIGAMTPGFHHPVVGIFGELVYARVFGNTENLHYYPNSYPMMGSNSPRLRQADKSLNRISLFLFCCFLLCLVVF